MPTLTVIHGEGRDRVGDGSQRGKIRANDVSDILIVFPKRNKEGEIICS